MTPLGVALVLALLMGLQPVTTDLMLTALPALAHDLSARMATVQLTMSGAIMAFGLAQLVWGPVADRFGRRPVLLLGLGVYALASLGASLAEAIVPVVLWRVAQGAAMSAAVVCGRAMVRDLYEPHEGAGVMARALTGLGLIAIICPLVGGVLVATQGWRAAVAAMGVIGCAIGALVARRLPETARHRHPDATRLGPLWRQTTAILAHPGFRAWTLLVSCSYGGLFIALASAGIVLIDVLGLAPAHAGLALTGLSASYVMGTLLCRRLLPRHGLAGTAARGARISLIAALLLALVGGFDVRSVWAVMLPMCVYAVGHGLHQPCGQAGTVAFFPRAAGTASALAGFVLAGLAFLIGLALGRALDGTVRPLTIGMAIAASASALVALTLVRRHGEPPWAAAA